MIPTTRPFRQPPAWQRALQDAVTDPAELLSLLGLGPEWLAPARAAARRFPRKVPRGFVARSCARTAVSICKIVASSVFVLLCGFRDPEQGGLG